MQREIHNIVFQEQAVRVDLDLQKQSFMHKLQMAFIAEYKYQRDEKRKDCESPTRVDFGAICGSERVKPLLHSKLALAWFVAPQKTGVRISRRIAVGDRHAFAENFFRFDLGDGNIVTGLKEDCHRVKL